MGEHLNGEPLEVHTSAQARWMRETLEVFVQLHEGQCSCDACRGERCFFCEVRERLAVMDGWSRGPWRFDEDDEGLAILATDGQVVAYVVRYSGRGRANPYLLLKAPELHAVLAELASDLDSDAKQEGRRAKLLVRAWAVLADARGEP